MTKVVRITSIIAVIAGVVVFVTPVFFGAHHDRDDKILQSPSIIEKFKKANGSKNGSLSDHKSPLVMQAEAFALYLNPPAPKTKSTTTSAKKTKTSSVRKASVQPLGDVSAKFDVIATSYYASKPELSLALINEPGKGFRWIKPTQTVGHLLIEQIKDGVIVVKDGARTFEIEAQRTQLKSLLKTSTSDQSEPNNGINKHEAQGTPQDAPRQINKRRASVGGPRTFKRSTGTTRPIDQRKAAAVDSLMSKLKALQAADGNDANSKKAAMNELISRLRGDSVSPQEAENLNHLGKDLEEAKKEPNRPSDRNGKLKAKPRKPSNP